MNHSVRWTELQNHCLQWTESLPPVFRTTASSVQNHCLQCSEPLHKSSSAVIFCSCCQGKVWWCAFYNRCFAQRLGWQKLFLRLSSELQCLTVTISQAAAIALRSKLSDSKLLCLPNPLLPQLSHTSRTLRKLALSVSSLPSLPV